MNAVTLYLDFVSPYVYLALTQLADFGRAHNVRWKLRPVVYGVLLDTTGLVGPVETTAKRDYTFRDVGRAAALLGVPLVGPPAHPFRSLESLRLLAAWQDAPQALTLAGEIAAAAWGQGRDLTSLTTLGEIADCAGLDGATAAALVADAAVRTTLRENTAGAVARGVFGVPTFEYTGELFWGHDRLAHLAARLDGRLAADAGETGALLRRPRGVDRAARR
jgi:2-hydroxychromene-2-carboxylate isomerase